MQRRNFQNHDWKYIPCKTTRIYCILFEKHRIEWKFVEFKESKSICFKKSQKLIILYDQMLCKNVGWIKMKIFLSWCFYYKANQNHIYYSMVVCLLVSVKRIYMENILDCLYAHERLFKWLWTNLWTIYSLWLFRWGLQWLFHI